MGSYMPDNLTKKGPAERNKIAMGEEHEVQYWTRYFGVSRTEPQAAVNKVGNSLTAVRKQLGK
jgi:hypothetical protein